MSGEWDELPPEITQIRARPLPDALVDADRILLAEGDPGLRQWLREVIGGQFGVDEVDRGEVALDMIAMGLPRLVIVGTRLVDMSGGDLLDRASQWLGERNAPISTFLLADWNGLAAEVDESRVKVFYRLVPTMQGARVIDLLTQASTRLPGRPPMAQREVSPQIAEYAAKLGAATDLTEAATAAIAATIALVGADRARCLFCDEDSGQVWAEGEGDGSGEQPELMASAGLVGFAIRTCATVSVPRAGDDTLYLHDVDDPRGRGRERLLVQPVAGLDGHVHAALVAIRDEKKPPFGDIEIGTIERLATAWAPYLQQLEMRIDADNILGDRLDQGPSDMFRQEAIVSLVRRGARGDVVRVHPGWVRAAYWLVLVSLIGAVSFAAVARVNQYAEGPAIIRFTGRSDVVALEAGTITALDVKRGETVKEGQILARLYDAEQLARVRGLDTEFERKLVQYLQAQADKSAQAQLAAVVSQRETARASLESRAIRAPRAGIVKEVYVGNGKVVAPGKVVLSIVESGTVEGLSVVAFLPGSERPRLRAKQPILLALPGYRGVRIPAEVRGVSSQVLGAAEARSRYLGERVGESFAVEGNVVVIDAILTTEEFESDGQKFKLHDGMVGLVEVQLASKSVLETVVPGFK
jgi:hypothetical protein